ncbi:unnamed protein product [Phytophthora fragariaefolia]|uniref:Unnamed protein product n=1 Tax=Phytophthora fragariaefolia TaxID=1490495 RepID=A0A9W6YJD0_9STRA|nr:unnamed protein product [Phytophthora fragariaefolia]
MTISDFRKRKSDEQATACTRNDEDAAPPPPTSSTTSTPVRPDTPPPKKKPKTKAKKKSKRQQEEEANTRRREVSSFSNVWGVADSNAAIGENSDDEAASAESPSSISTPAPDDDEDYEAPAEVLLPDTSGAYPFRQLSFTDVSAVDPKLVVDESEAFLQSNGEGGDDSDVDMYPSSASDSDDDLEYDDDACPDEALSDELARAANLMTPEEAAAMHLAVAGKGYLACIIFFMLRVLTYVWFLMLTDSSTIFDSAQLREMTATRWTVYPENTTAHINNDPVVDKVYDGYCGPSKDILPFAKTPIALFFYFLPKKLWRHIASESNRYWRQTLDARVAEAFAKQQGEPNQVSKEMIRGKLMKLTAIIPHELVNWIGLMVAHTLAPKRFEHHWATTETGVISAGTFGKVMARDRWREIHRFLHLSDNDDPGASRDRAWKIRPVLSTLEKTFKVGFVLGSRVAIDEGMLPSHSRHNPTRTFMKDKPHRWGSKCVMTCCAGTGVELDVGRKADAANAQSYDTKSGPAAVVRNIACVFRGLSYQGRRLVVTDRFYTSIQLAQQLRTMGFNFCGTIQTNRLGWCKELNYSFKKRPSTVPRGPFKMARASSNPGLVALAWVVNRPVYFLASQVSTKLTSVQRRQTSGEQVSVPCPEIVEEYQRFMGGVDRNDQLRLQAYSLQLAFRFQKYYKSLFLGLIDIALVNAYIVYTDELWEKNKKRKDSHYTFMLQLHTQLLKICEGDFIGSARSQDGPPERPIIIVGEHSIVQGTDKRKHGEGNRSRQRACKVCSLLKEKGAKRSSTTSYYCPKCSENKNGLTWLCNRVRDHHQLEGLTCAQIWHVTWRNGEFKPSSGYICDRATPTS